MLKTTYSIEQFIENLKETKKLTEEEVSRAQHFSQIIYYVFNKQRVTSEFLDKYSIEDFRFVLDIVNNYLTRSRDIAKEQFLNNIIVSIATVINCRKVSTKANPLVDDYF